MVAMKWPQLQTTMRSKVAIPRVKMAHTLRDEQLGISLHLEEDALRDRKGEDRSNDHVRWSSIGYLRCNCDSCWRWPTKRLRLGGPGSVCPPQMNRDTTSPDQDPCSEQGPAALDWYHTRPTNPDKKTCCSWWNRVGRCGKVDEWPRKHTRTWAKSCLRDEVSTKHSWMQRRENDFKILKFKHRKLTPRLTRL